MGFYLRKSISFGPVRFNLSKSGIGLSAGVKGFRFGTGPRGNYVHMGRGGLYYRATLPKSKPRKAADFAPTPAEVKQQPVQSDLHFREIESAATDTLTDSSSQEIIAEINKKLKRWPLWPLCLPFCFIDSPYAIWALVAALLVYIFVDKNRKKTFLVYDIDEETEAKIQEFYDAFKTLTQCSKLWHISEEANTGSKSKYNAGATSVIRRTAIAITYGAPKFIKTNVSVPVIPVGKQKLYFFPDKLFICEKKQVAALSYDTLRVMAKNQRFIESEKRPNDATYVDSTWLYTNKNGGPDKRFKDNRQLPIFLYSEILFTSATGLNEMIQCSREGVGGEFKREFDGYLRSGALTAAPASPVSEAPEPALP